MLLISTVILLPVSFFNFFSGTGPCSGLNGDPTQDMTIQNMSVTVLFETKKKKRIFAYIINELEMRSSWINGMDPKSTDTYVYKKGGKIH